MTTTTKDSNYRIENDDNLHIFVPTFSIDRKFRVHLASDRRPIMKTVKTLAERVDRFLTSVDVVDVVVKCQHKLRGEKFG